MKGEPGAASLLIELADGNITVRHGTDKVVLFEAKDVVYGSWEELWSTIYNFRTADSGAFERETANDSR